MTCGFVRNRRWWPVTGSRHEITHISACLQVSNVIPTAIPVFSGSGNKTTTEETARRVDL